jgi:hypothetical protein
LTPNFIDDACRWIQTTPSSTFLRESTWGFTILSALHVLGVACFGGVVLFSVMRTWRRIGAAWMLITGALLFWLEPLKCYHSAFFLAKMLLLLFLAATVLFPRSAARPISLVLWAGVILASQGIAFL